MPTINHENIWELRDEEGIHTRGTHGVPLSGTHSDAGAMSVADPCLAWFSALAGEESLDHGAPVS